MLFYLFYFCFVAVVLNHDNTLTAALSKRSAAPRALSTLTECVIGPDVSRRVKPSASSSGRF